MIPVDPEADGRRSRDRRPSLSGSVTDRWVGGWWRRPGFRRRSGGRAAGQEAVPPGRGRAAGRGSEGARRPPRGHPVGGRAARSGHRASPLPPHRQSSPPDSRTKAPSRLPAEVVRAFLGSGLALHAAGSKALGSSFGGRDINGRSIPARRPAGPPRTGGCRAVLSHARTIRPARWFGRPWCGDLVRRLDAAAERPIGTPAPRTCGKVAIPRRARTLRRATVRSADAATAAPRLIVRREDDRRVDERRSRHATVSRRGPGPGSGGG